MQPGFLRFIVHVLIAALSIAIGFPASAGVYLRPAISEENVNTYTRLLGLDADQSTILLALHETYHERWMSHMQPLFREFSAQERSAIDWVNEDGANSGQRAQEIYPDLGRTRRKINKEAAQLDASFFVDMRSVLTAMQLTVIDRVERMRERELLFTHSGRQLPEGRTDLVALVRSLDLPAEIANKIEDEFISDFEPRLIEAMQRSEEAVGQLTTKYWEIDALAIELRLDHPICCVR